MEHCPDMIQNMLDFLVHELWLTTEYTGKLGVEVSIRVISVSMQLKGLRVPENALKMVSCCDILKVSHGLMQEAGVEHIFGDLHDKVPHKHAEELKKMRPDPKMTKEEHGLAYLGMERYLQDNFQSCFPAGHKAPCLRHGCLCRVETGSE